MNQIKHLFFNNYPYYVCDTKRSTAQNSMIHYALIVIFIEVFFRVYYTWSLCKHERASKTLTKGTLCPPILHLFTRNSPRNISHNDNWTTDRDRHWDRGNETPPVWDYWTVIMLFVRFSEENKKTLRFLSDTNIFWHLLNLFYSFFYLSYIWKILPTIKNIEMDILFLKNKMKCERLDALSPYYFIFYSECDIQIDIQGVLKK